MAVKPVPTHIRADTPATATGFKFTPETGREDDGVCHCKIPDVTGIGECVKCHRPRLNRVRIFEMSTDNGETWTYLPYLPHNSHPFHACMAFGTYEEAGTKYRSRMVDKERVEE